MNIQKFLEKNIQLIDNNEYDELYSLLPETAASELTHVLLEAGINPLEYMSRIPPYYSAYLSIDSVDIPSTIVDIRGCAFERCDKLTSVVLPQSVKTIDDFVFYNCKNLERCVLPASLLRIGTGVFYNCSKLAQLTYLGTMEQFQRIDIDKHWARDTITHIECTDGVLARV